jgi:hypothetical protein
VSDFAVHFDATIFNHLLDVTTRTDTGLRQHLLQLRRIRLWAKDTLGGLSLVTVLLIGRLFNQSVKVARQHFSKNLCGLFGCHGGATRWTTIIALTLGELRLTLLAFHLRLTFNHRATRTAIATVPTILTITALATLTATRALTITSTATITLTARAIFRRFRTCGHACTVGLICLGGWFCHRLTIQLQHTASSFFANDWLWRHLSHWLSSHGFFAGRTLGLFDDGINRCSFNHRGFSD